MTLCKFKKIASSIYIFAGGLTHNQISKSMPNTNLFEYHSNLFLKGKEFIHQEAKRYRDYLHTGVCDRWEDIKLFDHQF